MPPEKKVCVEDSKHMVWADDEVQPLVGDNKFIQK